MWFINVFVRSCDIGYEVVMDFHFRAKLTCEEHGSSDPTVSAQPFILLTERAHRDGVPTNWCPHFFSPPLTFIPHLQVQLTARQKSIANPEKKKTGDAQRSRPPRPTPSIGNSGLCCAASTTHAPVSAVDPSIRALYILLLPFFLLSYSCRLRASRPAAHDAAQGSVGPLLVRLGCPPTRRDAYQLL
jgi:hypothetical protein